MPQSQLDRSQLKIQTLGARHNKLLIEAMHVDPDAVPPPLSAPGLEVVGETVRRIRQARAAGRPVMLAFGAQGTGTFYATTSNAMCNGVIGTPRIHTVQGAASAAVL
jgi:hypothetical protein